MKNFFLRTFTGIKKGLLTPNLPEEILAFQKNPIIRIFRVIGGLSTLTLLGRGYFESHGFIIYISIFFSLIFFIYSVYISIHRYRHLKKLLKNNDLDVKNSPLDRYASLLARIVACGKGLCETAAPAGTGLGLMLGSDEILKASGRDAFFGPLLGGALNTVIPKTELTKWADECKSATKKVAMATDSNKIIDELKLNTESLPGLSDQDRKDFLKVLAEVQKSNDDELKIAKKNVSDILSSKPKNK